MKLDRNKNPDGKGKYALLQLRKLKDWTERGKLDPQISEAIELLDRAGLLHWGSEGTGEQFFVLKYKDKFSGPALRAYALAVRNEIRAGDALGDLQRKSLREYGDEIEREASNAFEEGRRIPD